MLIRDAVQLIEVALEDLGVHDIVVACDRCQPHVLVVRDWEMDAEFAFNFLEIKEWVKQEGRLRREVKDRYEQYRAGEIGWSIV